MTELAFNKDEKSKLIYKITEIVERLLDCDDNIKANGKFIYIQDNNIEHEEHIPQEYLKKHPFIESFSKDRSFRNSLAISPSTGIFYDAVSENKETYTLVINEENNNEINIILEIEKN